MEKKQIENTLNKLFFNKNSVFFGKNLLDLQNDKSGNLLKRKLFRSKFNKDVFLSNLIKDHKPIIKTGNDLYDEIQRKFDEQDRKSNRNLPTFAKRINTREYDCHSTLYSVDGPLQLLHADIADLKFLKPSASEAKYALVFVDVFSSFVYTSGLKSRKNLVLKLEDFYKKILIPSKNHRKVRMQTDLEFTQNNSIKKLNNQYNVEMFSTKLNRGHAFAAEQKIRELKKLLVTLKRSFTKKKINNYKLLELATYNLNNKATVKYFPAVPAKVQDLTLKDENLKNFYNVFRLEKVQKSAKRYDRFDTKWNKKIKNYELVLNVGDNVLVASYRLLKKSDPGLLDKKTTDKKSYYNRQRVFQVIKRYKVSPEGKYYYRIKDIEKNKPEKGRFNRNDLYKL